MPASLRSAPAMVLNGHAVTPVAGPSILDAMIEGQIRANTSVVLDAVRAQRVSPRRAALDLAPAQVKPAMSYRRFSIL